MRARRCEAGYALAAAAVVTALWAADAAGNAAGMLGAVWIIAARWRRYHGG